jgi:hypothetical protein
MKDEFVLSDCPRNEQGHYLCQTRDGKAARIVCTDRAHENPIVVLIADEYGEYNTSRSKSGKAFDRNDDLVNIPVMITKYAGLYMHRDGIMRLTQLQNSEAEVRSLIERFGGRLIKILPPIQYDKPV